MNVAARIIDGTALAATLRATVAEQVRQLSTAHGITPRLAVILVGNNPASEAYVLSKARKTAESAIHSAVHRMPETTSEAELLAFVDRLNRDAAIHGILVQLPLPDRIDPHKVIQAIDPAKDVDGFHPLNVGRLATGLPALTPCTPLGCVMLARSARDSLAGLEAVVIGRSNIVGKPLAQLLLNQNATVTIAHSRTRDLPEVVRRADLVFAGVGRPEMVRGGWIKPGATVIDIGINRVPSADGKGRLVGDVAYAEVAEVAGAITPVPGGVGPMTIACLMLNTVRAAVSINGVAMPEILDRS